MPGNIQPLDQKFAIVTPDGRPTLYFIQWAQQKQIDISAGITAEQALQIVEEYLADHPLQAGTGISISPSGNLSDSPTIAAEVQAILDQITTTQGSVLFRGASDWQALTPGTAGQVLSTNGAGANPSWIAVGGGGSVAWTEIYANAAIPNPTANIDVDVTGYTDIYIIARLVSASASGTRQIQVSVDGGVTFYSTSGDYKIFDTAGSESNTTALISHSSVSTAARTIAGDILNIDQDGVYKLSREIGGGRQRLLTASTDAITHIRLNNSAGGNLTGGEFYVYGR